MNVQRDIDWSEDLTREPATNAAKRNNFVMPGLPTSIVKAEPPAALGYAPTVTLPGMPIVTLADDGVHAVERARAFVIKTSLLGAGFALAAGTLVLLVLVGRAPAVVTGLVTLTVLFIVFAGVWLYALRTEVDTSAGGVARMHANRLWNFIDAEQAHLHQMEVDKWKRQ